MLAHRAVSVPCERHPREVRCLRTGRDVIGRGELHASWRRRAGKARDVALRVHPHLHPLALGAIVHVEAAPGEWRACALIVLGDDATSVFACDRRAARELLAASDEHIPFADPEIERAMF